MTGTSIDKDLLKHLKTISNEDSFSEYIFLSCESQEDRKRLLSYIESGHTNRKDILLMTSQIGIESGTVEGELEDENGRIVNCTLTGDDLKNELLLYLSKVKDDKKFIEDIYNRLMTDQEKQAMVLFLNEPRFLTPEEVKLKTLEIIETIHTNNRKSED